MLCITGEDGLPGITATNSQDHSAGTAHGRVAAIADFNWQVVNILGSPAEILPGHVETGGAVCGDKRGESECILQHNMKDTEQ